eukprot:Hpha_TRINITY_DN1408_c0_g1::TRINITY_DN1408_c0_g1_i2::g.9616::m.9616
MRCGDLPFALHPVPHSCSGIPFLGGGGAGKGKEGIPGLTWSRDEPPLCCSSPRSQSQTPFFIHMSQTPREKKTVFIKPTTPLSSNLQPTPLSSNLATSLQKRADLFDIFSNYVSVESSFP